MVMRRFSLVMGLCLLVLGCSGDEGQGANGSGGSAGSTSGVGGTGGSGGTSGGSGGTSGGSGGTSGAGGSATGGSGGRTGKPGYTPFTLSDCDDGAVGDSATGPDALAGEMGPGVVYSDEEAVDGTGKSCKTTANAGNNFFGGEYRTDGMDVGPGDDIWMRHAVFFPNGFCFGYGNEQNDGWGATKWMRIEFDNGDPGNRLTLELGNFADNDCNATTEIWGAAREYAGATNCLPEQAHTLGTGAWHFVQWHVHLASDDSGFIRFWLNDQFLGQWDGQTLPDDQPSIGFIQYGDYWNGSPFQDVEWYIDEIIMTEEEPDTLDSEGQPFISPSTRVNDWD
jgi:hypothetical protein